MEIKTMLTLSLAGVIALYILIHWIETWWNKFQLSKLETKETTLQIEQKQIQNNVVNLKKTLSVVKSDDNATPQQIEEYWKKDPNK